MASLTYISKSHTVIVFFAGSLSYEGMHLVSDQLFEKLKPTSVTIIDSYSFPSYLSSEPITPSIRYLATPYFPDSSLSVDTYNPPNLVSGLSAALASHVSVNFRFRQFQAKD